MLLAFTVLVVLVLPNIWIMMLILPPAKVLIPSLVLLWIVLISSLVC